MSFIQENIIEINLNLNKTYKIIHFSDVHAITYNESDSQNEILKAINQEKAWVKVRKDFAYHFNEKCEEEHLIKSTDCLNNLIKYSNENEPDLVLLTGDIIDYYSKSNYELLKESLKKLNSRYLFSCGNHESPSNLYLEITNNNNEINYIEFEDIIFVSIDNSKKNINKYQLDKLKEIASLNKKIIISMHIPIETTYNSKDMIKFDSYFIMSYKSDDQTTREFIDFVVNNDNIKTIFCGHTHGYSSSLFSKDKYQYCASSGLIGFVNKILIK